MKNAAQQIAFDGISRPGTPSGHRDSLGSVLAGYLDEDELGHQLGKRRRTLRHWRQRGEGPSYVIVGRNILYPRAAVIDWLEKQVVVPVREREQRRRR